MTGSTHAWLADFGLHRNKKKFQTLRLQSELGMTGSADAKNKKAETTFHGAINSETSLLLTEEILQHMAVRHLSRRTGSNKFRTSANSYEYGRARHPELAL